MVYHMMGFFNIRRGDGGVNIKGGGLCRLEI